MLSENTKLCKKSFLNTIYEAAEFIYLHTFCHIAGVFIFKNFGHGSYIVKPLRIKGGKDIAVGVNVSILQHLRIEAWKKNPLQMEPCIVIGDDTNIEQNVHITAAESVLIGKGCSILGGVVITDIHHEYSDPTVPPSHQNIVTSPVKIGDQTFIGMHAVALPGVTIGKHCVIGANSVVTDDVSDYTVVAGVPAKPIKRYDIKMKKWIKV